MFQPFKAACVRGFVNPRDRLGMARLRPRQPGWLVPANSEDDMIRILVAAAMLGGVAGAAMAQDAMDPMKLTCGEFAAMDKDGMMKAVEAMGMASAEGAMAEAAPMGEDGMMMTMQRCEGHPEMMAMEAMMMK
jgi:hypothetical protein